MKIDGYVYAALVGVAVVLDQATAVFYRGDPPRHTFKNCVGHDGYELTINHDDVKAFPQPEADTIFQKAGVKFKPQLSIHNHGCHPYPAVNKEGETSGGLRPTGPSDGDCKGSKSGSQVYGRSKWYEGSWAIVYTWYFPKNSRKSGKGHRHDWHVLVVWINNPAVETPEIKAVSVWGNNGFSKQVPPSADTVCNTSVKVSYESHNHEHNYELKLTHQQGGAQDLIMWDQLTNEARCALNNVVWVYENLMPLADDEFDNTLKRAFPF